MERQLTTREVAEQLGTSKNTVIRMLTAAGIPRRPRAARRPRGARAAVTDAALAEVYQRPDMTVRRAAAHFGVSVEYLRRRVAQAGLIKRIGSFTPHSRYTPAQLQDRAGRLYRRGMTMRQVADRLGVSGSTVSRALHAARVPVRGNAVAHGDRSGRLLVDDLYADEQVREALSRFDVHVPDEWTEAGPFTVYAPLPLPAGLLQRLYTDIGLSAQHIALICGVGVGAVKSRLAQLGIPRRSPHEPSPWNQRRRQGG